MFTVHKLNIDKLISEVISTKIEKTQEGKNNTKEISEKPARLSFSIKKNAFDLLCELLALYSQTFILSKLFIHKGTLKRWLVTKKVPQN